jgi:LmbE family N-acetylglucosaminyl deacetylase
LQFPTVKLNAVPGKELNDRITEFIENVDPQVIYAPFPGDLNSDHGIVARSTAVAIRPAAGKSRSLVYFETLS